MNALAEGGVPADELERFTHGTTVGTNALIERTGCKVAFVTTKGFEDTPYIQRINRKVLYDLRWRKPEPLVASRRLCLGLDERLDAAGTTLAPSTSRRCAPSAGRSVTRVQRPSRSRSSSRTSRRARGDSEADLRGGAPGVPVSVSQRWRRSGASTSARRRRSPTPICARCSGRYVGSLKRRVARAPAMTREWTLMKSNGGAMLSVRRGGRVRSRRHVRPRRLA